MQPGDIALISVIALVVSVAYNVFQAMRLRRLEADTDAAADLKAEVERMRRELLGVRSDLTSERRQVESLKQDLTEVRRTRGTFFDNMGYYVRTPLNVIIGYSDLLLNGTYGALSDQARERITAVQRSGNDLLTYITDMLELHRLDYGAVTLNIQPVEVLPVVERVIADVQEKTSDEVELLHEVEPDIIPILGDAQRVEQVLSQLLINALRFTQKGSVTLAASGVQVKNGVADKVELPTIGWLRDGAWVVLSVRDTGIGIASQDQASIFDTFYRVHRDQTHDERGLGLGLAIVKRLLEMQQGVIWVKSVEKQGSTFFVALRAYVPARAKTVQVPRVTDNPQA
ncbi:MAG: HAMP domain-containing histidine kinase [Anaerolineae bacterium]|nr:HAMP domain-containing histidine kinase [Anaerolineae bacterium]